jgi:hypothetical protein
VLVLVGVIVVMGVVRVAHPSRMAGKP